MKKYLLLMGLSIASVAMTAQPTTPLDANLKAEVQPPAIVNTKFSQAYPNTKASWAVDDEKDVYSAQYRDTNTNMGRIVKYDNNGNFLSVENELHNDAYPNAIGKYFIKKYPGEKYAVWSYETAAGKSYYISREQDTVWFSADGKYNKTVKKKGASTAITDAE